MKQKIYLIMELPTKDQVFSHVCLKLGAFYKRFWRNIKKGIKSNPYKAG